MNALWSPARALSGRLGCNIKCKRLIGSFKIFFCIGVASLMLYAYIDKQNSLTELRRTIPEVEKEVRYMQEENTQLRYAIDQFESPVHLMELARQPEFGHLKYPSLDKVEILTTTEPTESTEREIPQ